MFALFPSRTVALELLGFSVHWYGVLYLLAFLSALMLVSRLQHWRNCHLSQDEWLGVVSAAVVGVLVGGRLGFVFFYEPQYFLHQPWKVFAVWEGGMASHGGFIGVVAALWLHAARHRLPKRELADLAAVPAAIGLALGRVGNFVNQELYGTITTLPWGISIPGVQGLRHPLPLYDAVLCLVIALICYLHLRFSKAFGSTLGLFFSLYGVERFSLEVLREQQYSLVQLGALSLTRGQFLTLPIFFAGIFMLWIYGRNKSA